MLKIVRLLQTPLRVLGILWYIIATGFYEGKQEGYEYLVGKYNEDHFRKK